jgi:enhancing lycopene biosynthesis protein 2
MDAQILSIAAHLHVLLRRKTGRVTDTEWMATDYGYAKAIAKFAKEHGQSSDDPDLLKWADKLEQIITPLAPVSSTPAFVSAVTQLPAQDQLAQRYIGRLR